jgi:hypothetical protein
LRDYPHREVRAAAEIATAVKFLALWYRSEIAALQRKSANTNLKDLRRAGQPEGEARSNKADAALHRLLSLAPLRHGPSATPCRNCKLAFISPTNWAAYQRPVPR